MHDWSELAKRIKDWGRELGFDAIGIAGIDLGTAEQGLNDWLAAGCHGEMDYMAAHGSKRSRPAELVPGTRAVIVARMNYSPLPPAPLPGEGGDGCSPAKAGSGSTIAPPWGGPAAGRRPASADNAPAAAGHADLAQPDSLDAARRHFSADASRAAISRYALGRDYHKLIRARLQKLADRIVADVGEFSYRVFTDSAPVMEGELAKNAGLGWRGKHTLLLSRTAGSWFFLGEIFVDLPLPEDAPTTDHCGSCRACLDACPTDAFLAPHRLDARRCISYLSIELKGAIPEDLRHRLGNHIYGCDDCQTVCPWNREAPATREADFLPRHNLDAATLTELFAWDEATFNEKLAGSPIRRIGHERWLRNIAVALGNAPTSPKIIAALVARRDHPSALVCEHVAWALARHGHHSPVAIGRDGSAHHSLHEPT